MTYHPLATILIPISPGELLDKISILELKRDHVQDPEKLANVRGELDRLAEIMEELIPMSFELERQFSQLREVNERLWGIEDDIRRLEKHRDFGPDFIALARSVYLNNDERASIKRRINQFLGADLVEEKQYCDYR